MAHRVFDEFFEAFRVLTLRQLRVLTLSVHLARLAVRPRCKLPNNALWRPTVRVTVIERAIISCSKLLHLLVTRLSVVVPMHVVHRHKALPVVASGHLKSAYASHERVVALHHLLIPARLEQARAHVVRLRELAPSQATVIAISLRAGSTRHGGGRCGASESPVRSSTASVALACTAHAAFVPRRPVASAVVGSAHLAMPWVV